MDFLPDILDHLGKTPREFGALHVHFESVTTIDGPRVLAKVLFQAAFDPLPPGAEIAFHVASAEGALGAHLGTWPAPPLADKGVRRMSYPLQVPEDGATHVVAFVRAPAPAARAKRLRPAWKLTDTLEIPKLSEMNPVSDNSGGFNLGRSLVGTALLGGAGVMLSFGSTTTIAANTKSTLHKARELPPGLLQPISTEVSPPIAAPVEETVWLPGQPLPAAPVVVYAPPPPPKPSAMRWCRSCGFEAPSGDYRNCPNCDESWG